MKIEIKKFILGMLLGIVFLPISVLAVVSFDSNRVIYNNRNNNLTGTTTQSATDSLYAKVNAINSSVTVASSCYVNQGAGTNCVVPNLKVGSSYFCIINARGYGHTVTVTGATQFVGHEYTYFFDFAYTTHRYYITATSTSVTFNIGNNTGSNVICYHIINTK